MNLLAARRTNLRCLAELTGSWACLWIDKFVCLKIMRIGWHTEGIVCWSRARLTMVFVGIAGGAGNRLNWATLAPFGFLFRFQALVKYSVSSPHGILQRMRITRRGNPPLPLACCSCSCSLLMLLPICQVLTANGIKFLNLICKKKTEENTSYPCYPSSLPALQPHLLLGLGFSWPGQASHNNFRNLVGLRDFSLPSPVALNNFQFESTAPSVAPSSLRARERERERSNQKGRKCWGHRVTRFALQTSTICGFLGFRCVY